MKQPTPTAAGGGGSGGIGGGFRIPSEDEVEVLEILLTFPKLIAKSEFLSRYTFTWGRKKKRSVVGSKSESSPAKAATAEPDKSPSTPLCFFPSGSGSDGGEKAKTPSFLRKTSKRKATDELMDKYNVLQQQREILIRELKSMKNLHQDLRAQNLELKARKQEVDYSRKVEDFQFSVKLNLEQQHYHQQISIFTPPQPQQQQQHCQQFMVDPSNGKLVAVHSNSGGRFGLFNQIEPRVKIHGETFDFMGTSQPLNQSNYLVMDNDLRVRSAAAARQRRIMKMKENKNSFKPARGSR